MTGAAESLRADGMVVHTLAFDVADPAAVEAGIDRLETEIGPLAILVNNAGMTRRGPLVDVTPETWHEILDTDLTSVFLVGQAAGRRMVTPRDRQDRQRVLGP